MDSDYVKFGRSGSLLPWFTGIVLKNVRVGCGQITLQGYDAEHRFGMTFDNVQFDSPNDIKVAAELADLKFGPGAVNLKVTGESVRIEGAVSGGAPNTCAGKFVPMPQR